VPEPLTYEPELDITWDAIRRLPERQRVVLVLRFYEDLTVGEIARTVDWPVGTVKSLLHRALNRLRKDLR
jgi:RNA polymerase sigma factor (sigma-70 family)